MSKPIRRSCFWYFRRMPPHWVFGSFGGITTAASCLGVSPPYLRTDWARSWPNGASDLL